MQIFNSLHHKDEADKKVEELSSAFLGKYVTYISGPITTGKDYIKYNDLTEEIDNESSFDQVKRRNEDRIRNLYLRLKEEYPNPIIEPTNLEIIGWTQDDYRYYWGEVITKYIGRIIFIEGWNYSNGCTFEYYMGLKNGIELLDEKSNPIFIEDAILLISKSIPECPNDSINDYIEFQRIILNKIKTYGNKM